MKTLYLRLSLSETCNLRCRYCRSGQICESKIGLGDPALLRIVHHIAEITPIHKVRLTGGEPLTHKNPIAMVRELRQLLPSAEICLTTNATLLAPLAPGLKQAGLDRINISLDTVDEKRFFELTGGGEVKDVISGIGAAQKAGLSPIKLNAVLLRSYNADNLEPLLELARSLASELRLIELMPIGSAKTLFQREYISGGEALNTLRPRYDIQGPFPRKGTVTPYLLKRGKDEIRVGLITPVSNSFCSACNRIRIDSRGILFSCLRQDKGVPLVPLLGSKDTQELEQTIRVVLDTKQPEVSCWPKRLMSALGG